MPSKKSVYSYVCTCRGKKRLHILVAIDFVQLKIGLQLILDFTLENFMCKSTLMNITTGIAMIHSPLWLCMYKLTYVYWFSNQVFVTCALENKSIWQQLWWKAGFYWWLFECIVSWLLIKLAADFFLKERETINLRDEVSSINDEVELIVQFMQFIPSSSSTYIFITFVEYIIKVLNHWLLFIRVVKSSFEVVPHAISWWVISQFMY